MSWNHGDARARLLLSRSQMIFMHPQRNIPPLADPAQVEVVHRSCSTTLLGGLLTSFHGAWVSTPEATRRAENKLVQLRAAQAAGFRCTADAHQPRSTSHPRLLCSATESSCDQNGARQPS